jgi:hypothetical protein
VAIVSNNQYKWLSENEMSSITNDFAKQIRDKSGGTIWIQFEKTIKVREFPYKVEGKRFDISTYQICFEHYLQIKILTEGELNTNCEYSEFDLKTSMTSSYGNDGSKSACDALQKNEIDEVWFFVMPGAKALESYTLKPNEICQVSWRSIKVFIFYYDHDVKEKLEELITEKNIQ